MEQEKAEKAKGQQADNRTFFGKYVSWNIIIVICMYANSLASVRCGSSFKLVIFNNVWHN